MRFRSLRLLTLSILLGTPSVNACFTLGKDASGICWESECISICSRRLGLQAASIEPLLPGFFTKQAAERYVIAGILPNSPAARAGLQEGDELVAVDGMRLPLVDFLNGDVWQIAGPHTLSIRRADRLIRFSISPLPVRIVLAAATADDPITAVSFRSAAETGIPPGPYLSGLITENLQDKLVVKRVLRGTPAEAAGVEPGAIILAASSGGSKLAYPSGLEFSDCRARLVLSIERQGQLFTTDFRMTSRTAILERLANSPMPPRSLRASVQD